MEIRFCLLLSLFFFFACKTEQKTQNNTEPIENNVQKEFTEPKQEDNHWQFVGFYTGNKLVENNQQLTYDLLLWKKNDDYLGYLYELWYVTDSNFGESQSKLVGEKIESTISLKGNLDEDFSLTIPDFSSEKFNLSLDFSANTSRSIHSVEMKPKELVKWAEPIRKATDEKEINAFINQILKDEMRHSGY